MKKIIFVSIATVFFSCCGVKESQEDSAKWKSDLQARIAMKDSALIAYKDTADMYRECQEGNRQLREWIK